jgi:hypothetical protein
LLPEKSVRALELHCHDPGGERLSPVR